MSTSIKIPMVEPDENVGILDEENQEKSLEQKQHEIYGLTIAEYDGIDKLFTMLTGSLHPIFGDDVLLVKILKLLIKKLSIRKVNASNRHNNNMNNDENDDTIQQDTIIRYTKCRVDKGIAEILMNILEWSMNQLKSDKKLQEEKKLRFEIAHMSIEHSFIIYNKIAPYYFPNQKFSTCENVVNLSFQILFFKAKMFKAFESTQLQVFKVNGYLLKDANCRTKMIQYFEENDGMEGYLAYLKKYSNNSDICIQILFSLASMLKRNITSKLSCIKGNGIDLIIDCLHGNAHQHVIYNASFCLVYLLNECYDGIEQLCDYESAEEYSFTKLALNLLTTYQNNSSIHRAIQKNIMNIFLMLSKIKRSKEIIKVAFQEGIIKKLVSSIRNYPDSIEIKKMSCWLLSVFITFTQNKIFKDVDSDFDSEDDEDDEFLDDEAPQTVFNLQNENLLKDQLRRNGVSKIIGRLIKFIELAEENITKEKEEIKAAEEKKDALKLKIRQKKFNNNNNNKNNEKNNRRDGEDEILINNDNEDEIELKNMIIPERKTFLDEHFVQCVYGANDALEWFNDYMDKMDNARALLEKLAQEEKEAAEMAKSGKK